VIGTLLGRAVWSGVLRTVLRYGAMALAVVLCLLMLRRSGERAARLAERLEAEENANAVQRKMLNAATDRPRGRDDLVRRLREGGF
jgi:tRNA(Phe) wybutosine-synthesizing methylase Tyw3